MNDPTLRHPRRDFSDIEIATSWGAVKERRRDLRARRRRRLVYVALASLAIGSALLIRTTVARRPADFSVASTTRETTTLLADGTVILLDPGGELQVHYGGGAATSIELTRGAARFNVPHVVGRKFMVHAARAFVQVVGTRFGVTIDESVGVVRVDVEEGTVMAGAQDGDVPPSSVSTGQTWSLSLRGDVAMQRGNVPEATAEVAPEPPPVASPRRVAGRSVSPPPVVPPAQAAPPVAAAPLDASALMQAAREATRRADYASAVEQYRRLVDLFPTDGRASRAAFEAGRLLHDHLSDFAGASAAYDQALQLKADGALREDVIARQVQALEALGKTEKCRAWRARYLQEFADGAHTPMVQESCR